MNAEATPWFPGFDGMVPPTCQVVSPETMPGSFAKKTAARVALPPVSFGVPPPPSYQDSARALRNAQRVPLTPPMAPQALPSPVVGAVPSITPFNNPNGVFPAGRGIGMPTHRPGALTPPLMPLTPPHVPTVAASVGGTPMHQPVVHTVQSHHHAHPVEKAAQSLRPRNKGVLCALYAADEGRCPVQNCPFAHIRASKERPVPETVCEFFDSAKCLRDKCKFFHGTEAQLEDLKRQGLKTYRPAALLEVADPMAPLTEDELKEVMMKKLREAAENSGEQSTEKRSPTTLVASTPPAQPVEAVASVAQAPAPGVRGIHIPSRSDSVFQQSRAHTSALSSLRGEHVAFTHPSADSIHRKQSKFAKDMRECEVHVADEQGVSVSGSTTPRGTFLTAGSESVSSHPMATPPGLMHVSSPILDLPVGAPTFLPGKVALDEARHSPKEQVSAAGCVDRSSSTFLLPGSAAFGSHCDANSSSSTAPEPLVDVELEFDFSPFIC